MARRRRAGNGTLAATLAGLVPVHRMGAVLAHLAATDSDCALVEVQVVPAKVAGLGRAQAVPVDQPHHDLIALRIQPPLAGGPAPPARAPTCAGRAGGIRRFASRRPTGIRQLLHYHAGKQIGLQYDRDADQAGQRDGVKEHESQDGPFVAELVDRHRDGLGINHLAHHATGRIGRAHQNRREPELLGGDLL
jgi:hypothetical protein